MHFFEATISIKLLKEGRGKKISAIRTNTSGRVGTYFLRPLACSTVR